MHSVRFLSRISLSKVAIAASLLATLVGLAVLAGWWLHVPRLVRLAAGWPAMAPADALGFLLAGIGLGLSCQTGQGALPRELFRWMACVCAMLAVGLGALILLKYLGQPGIERLIPWVSNSFAASHQLEERVSAHSGTLLILIGSAILLLNFRSVRSVQAAQVLAIISGAITSVILLGYLFGNIDLYTLNKSHDAGMPFQGAIQSALLSLGILCANPNIGIADLVFHSGAGGVLARRLLLLPFLLPITIGLLSLIGQHSGLLSREFSYWLFVIGYLTSFTCIIWWVGRLVQNTEQQRAQQERRLEQLVNELADANKELEAFSYSVSHDLRAPLRAIDGFSRILLEECASSLEGDYLSYLHDIRHNAQQMGKLIDSLLSFARLSRQPLKKTRVDMEEVVKECLEYLHDDSDRHQIKLTVQKLPACQADRSLLKQVWQNLIGNAFKYSRNREPAIIEIGCTPSANGQGPTYYVRDNGAGFDMTYAKKLFGVFQRLHRVEEFEGTGVGLAIVQRILHRHGGKAWAESTPDRGATFYFTVGKEEGSS